MKTERSPHSITRNVVVCLALPRAYAIGHTFMEVLRAHCGLDPRESHSLATLIADTNEGDGDPLALQLLDRVQQTVQGGGVNQVHCTGIEKNMFCLWAARGQRRLHPLPNVTDACEEEVATGAPDQQSGEGDRLGM